MQSAELRQEPDPQASSRSGLKPVLAAAPWLLVAAVALLALAA